MCSLCACVTCVLVAVQGRCCVSVALLPSTIECNENFVLVPAAVQQPMNSLTNVGGLAVAGQSWPQAGHQLPGSAQRQPAPAHGQSASRLWRAVSGCIGLLRRELLRNWLA